MPSLASEGSGTLVRKQRAGTSKRKRLSLATAGIVLVMAAASVQWACHQTRRRNTHRIGAENSGVEHSMPYSAFAWQTYRPRVACMASGGTSRSYLRAVYLTLDADEDGHISRNEFAMALKQMGECSELSDEEVSDIFDLADKNLDDQMSFDEFCDFVLFLQEELMRFRAADIDGDGLIRQEEFRDAYKSIAPNMKPSVVDALFLRADVNGDSLISLTEFMKADLLRQKGLLARMLTWCVRKVTAVFRR
eukprot:CAMPEP_0117503594 /NCGR_PEP_ID=MMETSP0784-20121206/24411_1 /TAXON_ID=39447 /ORGANISM="" /LENGTH=248 /DNA_ID=CAMNT_0005298917 /DNA_START=147 /DNA_END=893 /DNA_ORIENTATION=+